MEATPRPQSPPAGTAAVVCVVGMHRSGTSSLTGCLEEAGVRLGEVHRRNPWNPKGNRESQAIMDLHEDLLAASNGSWDHPPRQVGWLPEHRRRRDQIIASHASDSVWGFKDPRTLLTVEGWLEALPGMNFVGTFRNPWAVASSLWRRAGEKGDVERWLGLWLDYNRRLLRLYRRFEFPVVDFDLPPDAYLAQVTSVVETLGLQAPPAGFTFFDRALRSGGVPEVDLSRDVRDVYDELRMVAL